MSSYKIVESDENHVYVLVTNDDGSTFGQMIYGDERKTLAGIAAKIASKLTETKRPKGTDVVAPEVLDAIDKKTEFLVNNQES